MEYDKTKEECDEVHADLGRAIECSVAFEDEVWYDFLKEYGMEIERR